MELPMMHERWETCSYGDVVFEDGTSVGEKGGKGKVVTAICMLNRKAVNNGQCCEKCEDFNPLAYILDN